MENDCTNAQTTKTIKKHGVNFIIGLISCILFFITCFSAYNGYLAYSQGNSINEQIYAAVVILISISSFIGFVIIMQISHLIAVLKKENN